MRAPLMVVILVLACASDPRPSTHASQLLGVQVQVSAYPVGTVGAAANGFWLDMAGVRRWYGVMDALGRYASEHPEYHATIAMTFNSRLNEHLAAIQSDTVIAGTLTRQNMTPREFVVLSVVTGTARASQKLVDSLGAAGRPVNIGGDLLAFWRAHRAEIDSLDATLR